MTKAEQVDAIIKMTEEIRKDKNKKRFDRRMSSVRIDLLKAPPKALANMLKEMIEKGAQKYYDDKEAQFKKER